MVGCKVGYMCKLAQLIPFYTYNWLSYVAHAVYAALAFLLLHICKTLWKPPQFDILILSLTILKLPQLVISVFFWPQWSWLISLPFIFRFPVFHVLWGVTWNMETLAMSTDSFQPAAAVSKRLLTSQVENQAQQRRFPPLQKGTSGDEVGNVGFYIQGMKEVGQTYDWSHISLLFSTRVANQIILYYDRRWSSRWWIYLVSCRLKKIQGTSLTIFSQESTNVSFPAESMM